MNIVYSKLTRPAFIPSISEGIKLDLTKLMPHVISAIQDLGHDSVMLSVYDLTYGELLSSYGKQVAEDRKSVKQSFGFKNDTTVFLDSGGLESIKLHGRLLWNDPLDVYAFQEMAKADVWVILDHPTQPRVQVEENKRRIRETIEFARTINKIHDFSVPLAAVAHGHDQESLIECAKELARLEKVQIVAIPAREPFGTSMETKLLTLFKIRAAINEIDQDKHIHILGSARMKLWPFYVLGGVSTIDATDWLAYKANPENLSWDRHPKIVNAFCDCKVCKRFPGKTVEEICSMGPVFRLQHNLALTKLITDRIRKQLTSGNLRDYARKFNPKLYTNLMKYVPNL